MVVALLQTLLLNAGLGLAGYWSARHGFRQPAGLTRGLAAVVLSWTWATLGIEVVGFTGQLSPAALGLWTALGLAIGLAFRLRDRGPEAIEATDPGGPGGWEAGLAMGLCFWASLLFGMRSLLLPVKVVSDGPIYHLYFAARWWKAGRVSLIAAPFGENAATYFPAGGDLWFTWLMTSWGGDRLARVGQVPFFLAAVLAAYALARRLGAGRSAAIVASTWFACSGPLFLFSFEPNVDTIFVAGYLLAAFFLIRYALGDDRGATLALAGLAAGGALGAKPTGVVFVPVLLALGAACVLRRPFARARKAAHLAILAASPLVPAGAWYGRNILLTGNPLYPLQVTLLGQVVLPGWYDRSVMRFSAYYIPADDWRALVDLLLLVLDPRMVPVWLAALLLGGLAPGGTPERRWVRVASALALVNGALFWLAIPYRTQSRFMVQALGVGVVPLSQFFDRARWIRAAAALLLALHLLTPDDWPFGGSAGAPWDLSPLIPSSVPPLIALPGVGAAGHHDGGGATLLVRSLGSAGAAAMALAVGWLWNRAGDRPSLRRKVAATAATLGVFTLYGLLISPPGADPRQLFYPQFPDYFRGWLALELRAGPSGARVAYAGTDIPYYLLGAGLRNEVRYINVAGDRTWLLHDYHRAARERGEPNWPNSRPGWDRIAPDYATWLANLRAERIQLLVVTHADPANGPHNIADREGFPIERTWADTHPDVFEPVYGVAPADPRMKVYRVRPTGAGEGS